MTSRLETGKLVTFFYSACCPSLGHRREQLERKPMTPRIIWEITDNPERRSTKERKEEGSTQAVYIRRGRGVRQEGLRGKLLHSAFAAAGTCRHIFPSPLFIFSPVIKPGKRYGSTGVKARPAMCDCNVVCIRFVTCKRQKQLESRS